ncbi:hypothetical protein ACQ4M3_37650 [Leptolyngbya sp. AN03gr2]|uniref:hypothetical protein n=1 Tax=unclassified Leptolyngbya TaxID=2650499 RepID=UPI003D3218EF
MALSPIAQYCIRKLLKQNFENLDSLFLAAPNPSGLSDDQIDRILQQFAFTNQSFQLQELELLTKLYQQLEPNPANSSAIAEIKRRIFQTLGFQLNAIPSTQLPQVIQESTIEVFRFFHDNQIREGIRFGNTLYAAVYQFDIHYRLQAYQMAWALSEAKVPLVVSLSPARFVIWVNLQSPSYPVLLCQDSRLLRTLLTLNLALRKAKVTGKRATKHLHPDFFGKKVVTVFPKITNSRDH